MRKAMQHVRSQSGRSPLADHGDQQKSVKNTFGTTSRNCLRVESADGVGFEEMPVCAGKQGVASRGGAESGAILECSKLAKIVESWPSLSDDDKSMIDRIVRSLIAERAGPKSIKVI